MAAHGFVMHDRAAPTDSRIKLEIGGQRAETRGRLVVWAVIKDAVLWLRRGGCARLSVGSK